MNSKCASVSYRWHQPIQYFLNWLPRLRSLPALLHLQSQEILLNLRRRNLLPQQPSTLPPPPHQWHRTQHLTITFVDPMTAMHIVAQPNLIAEGIMETLTLLGIELPRITMVATPLIEKHALVTITVKDLRDTTPPNGMLTAPAGDPYIKEKHIWTEYNRPFLE